MMITFKGWILLLSVSLLASLRETNGATAIMMVKLGDTVDIDFGNGVKEIKTKKMIVKDGKLTDFAVCTLSLFFFTKT